MELKKGYWKSDLGIIPNGWEPKNISEVCKLINGRGFKPFEWGNDGLPIIRIQNLNGSEDYNYFNGLYDKKIEVENDQLLFAWSGSRGTSFGPHIWKGSKGLLNYHTWKVVVNEDKISKQFFVHCLKHLTKQIENDAHGASALVHTQKWEMEKLKFTLPKSITEQTAIAKALSDTDELISSLQKLIEKKRNIRQGTMQQLLTGKKRLPPFNKSNIGYKQTELGLLPSDWELVSFGKAFITLRTATYSRDALTQSDDILYIHYGDIHTKFNTFLDLSKAALPTIPKNKAKNYSFVVEGDLIMVDASEDYTAINKSVEAKNVGSQKIISGLHTILLRDTEEIFSNGFRGYITLNSIVKNQFDKLATGMKVYGVSKNNLKKIFIPIPPTKAEQSAIAEFLRDMDSEIELLEKKRDKYKAIKQGMMQELLTGKTRLV